MSSTVEKHYASCSVCGCRCVSLSLSLSLTHTHTLSLSLSLSHALSLSLSVVMAREGVTKAALILVMCWRCCIFNFLGFLLVFFFWYVLVLVFLSEWTALVFENMKERSFD